MARRNEEIKEMIHEQVETIKLETFVRWNRKVCGTAVTALLAFGAFVGNWIMNHSERTYAAMYVLVFGEMPK